MTESRTKRSLTRRTLFILIGTLPLIALITALILPFTLDGDRYRSRLVSWANQYVDGQVRIGKVSFSVWNQVRIQLDQIEIRNRDHLPVFAAKSLSMIAPLQSILRGAPIVDARLSSPVLTGTRDADGKSSWAGLFKSPAGAAARARTAAQGFDDADSTPGLVRRALVKLDVQGGELSFQDAAHGTGVAISNAALSFKGLSYSQATQLEFTGDLDSRLSENLSLRGLTRFKAKVKPDFRNGSLAGLAMDLNADLTGMDVIVPGQFQKTAGAPASAEGGIKLTAEEARLDGFKITFLNTPFELNGSLLNLQNLGGAAPASADLSFKTGEINLAAWTAVLPALNAYSPEGSLTAQGTLHGLFNNLGYGADVTLKDVTWTLPGISGHPLYNGTLKLGRDEIESFALSFKAAGSEWNATGKLASLSAEPELELKLSTPELDLGQALGDPAPAAAPGTGTDTVAATAAAPAPSVPATAPAPAATGPAFSLAHWLEPLRQSELLARAKGKVALSIASIKGRGLQATGLEAEASLQDRTITLGKLSAQALGGSLSIAEGRLSFQNPEPQYSLNATIDGINVQDAVLALQKMPGAESASLLPALRQKAIAKASLKIENGRVDDLLVHLSVPGKAPQDLDLQGRYYPGNRTRFGLDIKSRHLDLDALLELPSVPSDLDARLAGLQQSQWLVCAIGDVMIDIKSFKAYGLKVGTIDARLSLRELEWRASRMAFNAWGGRFQGTGHLDLASQPPAYDFSAKADHVDLQAVGSSRLISFKSPLSGRANLTAQGSGASLNPRIARNKLRIRGMLNIHDARFTRIDLARFATDGLNQSLRELEARYPSLKGQTVRTAGSQKKPLRQQYQLISGFYRFEGMKFQGEGLTGRARFKEGMDFAATVNLGPIDQKNPRLDARIDLIDLHNLTHARQISADYQGAKVSAILAARDRPIRVPVQLGCTLNAPCARFPEAGQVLGKVAAANATQAVALAGAPAGQKPKAVLMASAKGQAGAQAGAHAGATKLTSVAVRGKRKEAAPGLAPDPEPAPDPAPVTSNGETLANHGAPATLNAGAHAGPIGATRTAETGQSNSKSSSSFSSSTARSSTTQTSSASVVRTKK